MKIEKIKDNDFRVSFLYSPQLVGLLQGQPKRRFDPKTKSWVVTVKTIESQREFVKLLGMFKWELANPDLIKDLKLSVAEHERVIVANKNGSDAKESEFRVDGLKKELYPFQKAAVEYIVRNKRVLVGDEMGLGKTITTIAAVHYLNEFPVLVIVPNTLKRNWEREFNDWIDASVVILDSADDIWKALETPFDVMIANYNTAVKYVKELKEFGFAVVVADESHYLKSSKAQRTKAVKKIAKGAGIVLELTGTAVVNRPRELVSQLEILSKIDEFGGAWKYLMRYCDGKQSRFGWDFSGSSNLEELHDKMMEHCYVRRESKDVLPELPDLTRSLIELPISNRGEYTKAETDLLQFLRDFEYSIDKVAKWHKKESGEVWDDMSEEDKKEVFKRFRNMKVRGAASAEHLVQINALKRLVGHGKKKAAIEWVEDFLESGKKLVLFAHHTDLIKAFADHFKAPYITGEVSADKRQDIIDDFQDNPDTRLIVLNIAVGGVGITLTAASHLAFLEQGWTPGEMSQAEKRIHRIGQKNHSMVYYLTGERTIDQPIFRLINKKREVTDAVNKGMVEEVEFKVLNELVKELKLGL